MNHSAKVSRSSHPRCDVPHTANTVNSGNVDDLPFANDEISDSEESLLTFKPATNCQQLPHTVLKVNAVPISFIIATGASIDIIVENGYNKMQ